MTNNKQSFFVLSQDDVDRITSLLENMQSIAYRIIFAKQVKYSTQDNWIRGTPSLTDDNPTVKILCDHPDACRTTM